MESKNRMKKDVKKHLRTSETQFVRVGGG